MSLDNQSVVQRAYDSFARGDLDGLLDMLTEDVRWSTVGPEKASAFFGERIGREGAAEYFRRLSEIVEITDISPNQFLTNGDTVVVLGHSDGVSRRTGDSMRAQWVQVFTVRGDQISSYQEFADNTVILDALAA